MDENHENPNEPSESTASADPADGVDSTPPTDSAFHAGPDAPFEPHFDAESAPSERTYAMWIHLASLLAWVLAAASQGIGFWVPILVAGVMWSARRRDSPFIDDHGREALNFQISLILMSFIAVFVGMMLCFVGLAVTVPAVAVLGIVGSILGAVAASRGQYFRYPATIRFIRS